MSLENLNTLAWGPWLYTLVAAGISAAVTALGANPLASALGAPQFTARQLGIIALSAAATAIFAILRTSPLPDRRVAIALLSGVHTPDDLQKVMSATASGTVPSQAIVTAILAPPAPAPSVADVPKVGG